jgi:hypothetical protein
MTAPNASRKTGRNLRKFLRVAAGTIFAASLTAAPAFAQTHDGHGGRGGHWRGGDHRGGALNHGYRGHYGGGWNRGYAGRVHDGWRGGWNRSWAYRPSYRRYGPAFAGFGYYTDPYWFRPYIGLSAWNWSVYDALTEAEIRAQQDALIAATTAPLSDPIDWNDGNASGTVTPTREGHTEDGRLCREFQQQVTIAGKRTQAFGTACQESDGSWQIVDQGDTQ